MVGFLAFKYCSSDIISWEVAMPHGVFADIFHACFLFIWIRIVSDVGTLSLALVLLFLKKTKYKTSNGNEIK